MKQSGFTIIELIIVIVVVGILSSIAVIKYLDMQSAAASEMDAANAKLIKSSILLHFSKEISGNPEYQLSDAVDDYNANSANFFANGQTPLKSDGSSFNVSCQNDEVIVI